MTRPTWPHLENLDRVLSEYDPDFLRHPVWYVVTEKVHGFNARFGKDEKGIPWCGSRNQVVAEGDPANWPDALQGFVRYAAGKVRFLHDGETLFGEWAGKGVQKGIDYGEKNFYAFGAMWTTHEGVDVLDPFAMVRVIANADYWAEGPTGISLVPVLYEASDPPSLEELTSLRDGKSSIAEQTREGIVIFAYPTPMDHGRPVIAKFKSAHFNEVARAPKAAKELPDMEAAMHLVREYATPQRLEHAVQRVGEEVNPSGIWMNDPLAPAYTGHVLRAMYEDIVREAGSEYEALSDESKKSFGKVLNPTTKRLLDEARLTAVSAA